MSQQVPQKTDEGNPAESYERYFVPAIALPLAHDLVELAALEPGERVLDVACGTGVVARLAAGRAGRDGVAGVDANPGMIAVARGIDPELEWHEASAAALPLGDAAFDVVLCQMGLQFFGDRAGALREMRRVLAPGGRIAVNAPGPTPPPFAAVEDTLARRLDPAAGRFVATVFSLHEPGELEQLLGHAGFGDVRARAERKTLRLPPPRAFLWQYLYSTPLADAAKALAREQRDELEREVVAAWEPFVEDGALVLEVGVASATGRAA